MDERLVGCTLPATMAPSSLGGGAMGPQPAGVVVLSVPHVVASAAAQKTRLPTAGTLVRVRWLGDSRGSLFRPMPLAADSASVTTETLYPIFVDATRFVAYLHEMVRPARSLLVF